MPTIAYKVNDWLSVGAGVRAQYFKVRYFSAIGPSPLFPSPFAPSAGLEGDSWGIGYSLGATLTPAAGTSIGIGFRSAVQQDLEGEFQYSGVPIKVALVLPIRLGRHQPADQRSFSLHGTVEWTNWSRLGSPRVYNEAHRHAPGGFADLPLEYDDGWFFSVGGEYQRQPGLDGARRRRLRDLADRYREPQPASARFRPHVAVARRDL